MQFLSVVCTCAWQSFYRPILHERQTERTEEEIVNTDCDKEEHIKIYWPEHRNCDKVDLFENSFVLHIFVVAETDGALNVCKCRNCSHIAL